MLYEGFTNKQIANALKLSDGTSRNYISSIYVKMECDNRTDAVKLMKETINK